MEATNRSEAKAKSALPFRSRRLHQNPVALRLLLIDVWLFRIAPQAGFCA